MILIVNLKYKVASIFCEMNIYKNKRESKFIFAERLTFGVKSESCCEYFRLHLSANNFIYFTIITWSVFIFIEFIVNTTLCFLSSL